MFRLIPDVLTGAEIEQLRALAANSSFIDGKISAAGSPVKNNLRVGDDNALRQSAQIMADALFRNEDFRVFAFPKTISMPCVRKWGLRSRPPANCPAVRM